MWVVNGLDILNEYFHLLDVLILFGVEMFVDMHVWKG